MNCDHESKALVMRALDLAIAYIPHPSGTTALRQVCKGARDIVDVHAKRTRTVTFEHVSFASMEDLIESCVTKLNLERVERLTFDNCTVKCEVAEEGVEVQETFSRDFRTPVSYLPLGILSRCANLRILRVTSTGIRPLLTEKYDHAFDSASSALQIGLANLYEIGQSCKAIESIVAFHEDYSSPDTDGLRSRVDMFGPDATPQVVRLLLSECPKLREIDGLSTPGIRVLSELRRINPGLLFQFGEYTECFTKPWIRCLADSRLSKLRMFFPSPTMSHGSARNLVTSIEAMSLGGLLIGELGDLQIIPGVVPSSLALHVVVRQPAFGYISSNMEEGIERLKHDSERVIMYREALAKQILENVTIDFASSESERISTRSQQSNQLDRASSFQVAVSTEPDPRRSATEESLRDEPIARTASQHRHRIHEHDSYEPEDASGGVVRPPGSILRNLSLFSQHSEEGNQSAREGTEFDPFVGDDQLYDNR